jgi:hypothetical protein
MTKLKTISQAIAQAQHHVEPVQRVGSGSRTFGYAETDLSGRRWDAKGITSYQQARTWRAIAIAGYALHYLGVEEPHCLAQGVCQDRNIKKDVRSIVHYALAAETTPID